MPYPGGKAGSGVYQRIINLMPPHQVYIEPFLGDGAVMRAKLPATVNIGVDRDPEAPGLAWLREVSGAMNGRRPTSPLPAWWDPNSSDKASGSEPGGFGVETKVSDAIKFLKAYRFFGSELVYCDPPYVMSTRKHRRIYRYELSDVDHHQLLRCLRKLPCAVMVSGYWSPLYARELAGWTVERYKVMTRGGKLATEYLWFNFPRPVELHDYRYLGENFRERERIRRRMKRWCERLRRMPVLEQQALYGALQMTVGGRE